MVRKRKIEVQGPSSGFATLSQNKNRKLDNLKERKKKKRGKGEAEP